MKYLKFLIIALVAMFSFAKADAAVRVGHPRHRRVVVVHHRPVHHRPAHRKVVVVHHR